MYLHRGKRLFDLILTSLLAVVLMPVASIAALALVFANQGNPFFFQDRPGYQGRIFRLVKFKTMRDAFDNSGNPLPDNERMTRLGSLIRKTSIDELPQLWNVLRGEMSLVGPRPLLVEYLPLYNSKQSRRHAVKPGITGWAQVNGRNSLTWDEKFELDVWYVDHISFLLDLKILALTVMKVVFPSGVNNATGVPMPRFTGNDPQK